jgi:probable F420-dependent oxidoreductase
VPVRVGIQLHPQACSVDQLRTAWREADRLGAHSIWLWDHFYPLYGDPDAEHYECYTLLSAMAVETEQARIGALVTCNSYRNPELLADMSRTIDHLSAGRFTLGIGSGWFERDYDEYGYDFGTAGDRLRSLEASLPRIRARLAKLNPPPVQAELPILIGGSGEKVTLRLVAEHAQGWNTFGPPENFAAKNTILDEWCAKIGRAPEEITRTVGIAPSELDSLAAYEEAGADEVIFMTGAPFDLEPLKRALG